jgi:hypothetical protein
MARRKDWSNPNDNEIKRAKEMIRQGYVFKDISKSIPAITMWFYNKIFLEVVYGDEPIEPQIKLIIEKPPYYPKEQDMEIQMYSVNDLNGPELEILYNLKYKFKD